ncbi:MAG TPA: glycoside hydrolase family 140 protein, partial [Tepidisphaeraceae bacterium]|nr:glycoside hydrolase family 140 protein [Tepidisphaeraceae bacterium]
LLKVSDNRRYLVTANNNSPFFWTGDTAWRLFYDTGSAGADQYLADRAAKGFNVVYATAFNLGFDSLSEYGHGTFAGGNINTPNDAFFTYVDYVVARAASLGLYVALLPAWGESVSYADSRLFDTTSAFNYTKWLATRYQNQTNIIWVLGGDAPGDDGTGQAAAIWRAMAAGLQAGDAGKHLVSFHPMGNPASSSTWFQSDTWLDFHMVESGHTPNSSLAQDLVAVDYNRASPIVRPIIDFENNYENLFASLNSNNPPMTDYDVRKKNYWAVFAGAFGATYGNWEIYEFNTELDARFPYKRTWQEALNYPGAHQMKHLRRLMESRPVLSRIPDQSILTTSALSGADHIRATRASDGAYAMIYSASGRGFSVNMAKVAGPTVDAHWFNPRTGQATYIGRYNNTGTRAFTPPTANTDWVLVLDQTTRAFKTPGAV